MCIDTAVYIYTYIYIYILVLEYQAANSSSEGVLFTLLSYYSQLYDETFFYKILNHFYIFVSDVYSNASKIKNV